MSPRSESNRRPPPYQGGALPPELHGRFRLHNPECNRTIQPLTSGGGGIRTPVGIRQRIYSPPRLAASVPLRKTPIRANGQSRTGNLLITNQLLCQLSYAGVFLDCADCTEAFSLRQETVWIQTFRLRGPSNSHRKIPCHLPKARRPPRTGTSCDGPTNTALTWAGEFPSRCLQASPGTIRSSASSRSSATDGSACSFIVTPAVV